MKRLEIIKEEMNRNGWSNINHSLSLEEIQYFKKEMIETKDSEIKILGEDFLRKHNCLDILKCHFKFKKEYIKFIESKWLNDVIDVLLNKTAIIYDFFGLLNIDQKNKNHSRNKFHRDQAFLGGMRASVLVIIPLVDFTEEVGPTEIVPGSHLFKEKPSDEFIETNKIKLMAKAGEVFIVDASLWHRGGDNLTNNKRPAIILRYQLPFLKRYMDLSKIYEKELETSSELIRQRMGMDCQEMTMIGDLFEEPKFKKGQYDMNGLYYHE